jgi:hypothetical protein
MELHKLSLKGHIREQSNDAPKILYRRTDVKHGWVMYRGRKPVQVAHSLSLSEVPHGERQGGVPPLPPGAPVEVSCTSLRPLTIKCIARHCNGRDRA